MVSNVSETLSSIGNRFPSLCYLSYSFYGAWILLSVTGVDMVTMSGTEDTSNGFLLTYMLSGIPLTICLFLAGFFDKHFNPLIAHGPFTLVMSLVAAVSTFLVASGVSVKCGDLAHGLCLMATGLGTAFVCLRVGLVTSRLSGPQACLTISGAALLAFLIYFTVRGAPAAMFATLLSLLPLLSVDSSFCLPTEIRNTSPLEDAIDINKLPRGFFPRLILAVAVFALTAGVPKGLGVLVGGGTTTPLESIVSIICIAALMLTICLVLKTHNFNISSAYLPMGLLMAFAMLITPILSTPTVMQSAVAGVLYNIFVIVAWCMFIDLAGRTTLTPTRVFGFGRGASALGTTAGIAFIVLNREAFTGDFAYYVTFIAVMSVLLIAVYTLALSTSTVERAFAVMLEQKERAVRKSIQGTKGDTLQAADGKGADGSSPASLFDQACTQVSTSSGLTPRETEAFRLLARGRSISYIADELVIAQSTAKGYVKNIYAKLGVHSRQELIDQVEKAFEEMS